MSLLRKRWMLPVIVAAFVVVFIMLMKVQTAAVSEKQAIKVYSDNHQVEFAINPFLEKGTTLVQLRPLFESLGIELDWDGATRTVTGIKGDLTFSLVIGQPIATVNGKEVKLALPGKLINGHTMVPIRFVGESTGAAVGWHGDTRTIGVYSSEFLQITGLSREQAENLANSGAPAASAASGKGSGPSGFYARGSADLLGVRGCHGMCWDYYYFVNDRRLLIEPPDETWDTVDCREQACLNYEIKGGQLIIEGDARYSFEQLPEGDIVVNGDIYTKHKPLKRHTLDGKYDAFSYIGNHLGGGFASTSTLIFRPDGTFYDDSSISVITDGSEWSGDGTGVSSTIIAASESSGRYAVIGHSILLEYKNGASEVYLFFRPDLNDDMLKIGGRDFIIDETFDPDSLQISPSGPDDGEAVAHEDPYPDKLTTEGIAEKTIIDQKRPGDTGTRGGVAITLEGYQWAELDIMPEYRGTFNGFGDGTIVALTVKYTVENNSADEIDLGSLGSAVWEYSGHVLETRELAPEGPATLAVGRSAERLAVFLFPKDLLQEFGPLELVFSGLKTTFGRDVFNEIDIDFDMNPPY